MSPVAADEGPTGAGEDEKSASGPARTRFGDQIGLGTDLMHTNTFYGSVSLQRWIDAGSCVTAAGEQQSSRCCYFLVPNSPPRFSGIAKPGGAVAGSCAGGLGAGGLGAVAAIWLEVSWRG